MEIIIDHKPSILEMDALVPPNYYNFNGTIYIHSYLRGYESWYAKKIFYQSDFECPWCWTMYKKDGTPYKRAKRTIHFHGAHVGFLHKSGHCKKQNVGDGCYYVCTTRDVNGNLIEPKNSYPNERYPEDLCQPNAEYMWTNIQRKLYEK